MGNLNMRLSSLISTDPRKEKGEGGGKSRREYLVYIYTFNTVLVPKKTFQGSFHSFKGNNLTGNWSNKTLSFI